MVALSLLYREIKHTILVAYTANPYIQGTHMTFEQKLEAKIKAAQVAKAQANNEAMEALLDNPDFIEAKRTTIAKQAELDKLNAMILQLNNIKSVIKGTTYQVRVFPTAVPTFGNGVAQIIGITLGVQGAFTDEMAQEYSAITGISTIELQEAAMYLGATAYCTKDGRLVAEEPGDFTKFLPLLQSITLSLGITEFDVSKITKDTIDIYFLRAQQRAAKQLAELALASELDTNEFTLED